MYIKSQNKWWCGYKQQPYVVLDDGDPGMECLRHHLKLWLDKWGITGENKGGNRALNYDFFVITS